MTIKLQFIRNTNKYALVLDASIFTSPQTWESIGVSSTPSIDEFDALAAMLVVAPGGEVGETSTR